MSTFEAAIRGAKHLIDEVVDFADSCRSSSEKNPTISSEHPIEDIMGRSLAQLGQLSLPICAVNRLWKSKTQTPKPEATGSQWIKDLSAKAKSQKPAVSGQPDKTENSGKTGTSEEKKRPAEIQPKTSTESPATEDESDFSPATKILLGAGVLVGGAYLFKAYLGRAIIVAGAKKAVQTGLGKISSGSAIAAITGGGTGAIAASGGTKLATSLASPAAISTLSLLALHGKASLPTLLASTAGSLVANYGAQGVWDGINGAWKALVRFVTGENLPAVITNESPTPADSITPPEEAKTEEKTKETYEDIILKYAEKISGVYTSALTTTSLEGASELNRIQIRLRLQYTESNYASDESLANLKAELDTFCDTLTSRPRFSFNPNAEEIQALRVALATTVLNGIPNPIERLNQIIMGLNCVDTKLNGIFSTDPSIALNWSALLTPKDRQKLDQLFHELIQTPELLKKVSLTLENETNFIKSFYLATVGDWRSYEPNDSLGHWSIRRNEALVCLLSALSQNLQKLAKFEDVDSFHTTWIFDFMREARMIDPVHTYASITNSINNSDYSENSDLIRCYNELLDQIRNKEGDSAWMVCLAFMSSWRLEELWAHLIDRFDIIYKNSGISRMQFRDKLYTTRFAHAYEHFYYDPSAKKELLDRLNEYANSLPTTSQATMTAADLRVGHARGKVRADVLINWLDNGDSNED